MNLYQSKQQHYKLNKIASNQGVSLKFIHEKLEKDKQEKQNHTSASAHCEDKISHSTPRQNRAEV